MRVCVHEVEWHIGEALSSLKKMFVLNVYCIRMQARFGGVFSGTSIDMVRKN